MPSADHVTSRSAHGLFEIPNGAPGGVVPIQVVGFHILRWPLKRYAGRAVPGSGEAARGARNLQGLLAKEPSHVNAASQARERLKLEKGRAASAFRTRDGNSSSQGDLELLPFSAEEKEAS